MIEKLLIKNVALIDHAEIDFSNGLNVLSGETGAGKSVILDSINFVLGMKADKSMIRYGASECFVQAVFEVTSKDALKELEEMDVESDGTVVLSRKMTENGKGSIKINGIPVNATMLRRVTAHLVDVHGQSEHFYLLKESNQLKVLDRAVGEEGESVKTELASLLTQKKIWSEKIDSLGGDESERARKIDVLKFQIEEIQNAKLSVEEEGELIAKRNKLQHMEKIVEAIRLASDCFASDSGIIDRISSAKKSVSSISKFGEEYEIVLNRIESLRLDAEDLSESISDLSSSLYFDEDEASYIEERLDTIKLLKRKYGGDVESVLKYLEKAQNEYDLLCHCDEEIERATAERTKINQTIYKLARKLTDLRKKTANRLEKNVVAELKTLNIKNAQFSIGFNEYDEEDIDNIGQDGNDKICFSFSANAGEPLKPLGKIISGGEMSRFMLALKTQMSDSDEISTYIFDEIDAGISGITATVVAQKFAQISTKKQIIAVSHLAQIASMSDREFLIEKAEEDGKTHTRVKALNEEERINELIRLIGGTKESESARMHAKELLESSKAYKNAL